MRLTQAQKIAGVDHVFVSSPLKHYHPWWDGESLLWRAEASYDANCVEVQGYPIIAVTPKGWWILRHPHIASEEVPAKPLRRWTNGKWASPTVEEAIERLRARSRAYLSHCRRRLKQAEARCRLLGVDTTPRTRGMIL